MALSATTTRGLDKIAMAARGMIPGPSTGCEVFVPGRQGIRACRDFNPACGSADLFGTPSAVLSVLSIPFLLVVSRRKPRELLSWHARILPYLEQDNLYRQ